MGKLWAQPIVFLTSFGKTRSPFFLIDPGSIHDAPGTRADSGDPSCHEWGGVGAHVMCNANLLVQSMLSMSCIRSCASV